MENTKSMAQKFREMAAKVSGNDLWVNLLANGGQTRTMAEKGIVTKSMNAPLSSSRSITFTDGSIYSHPHWQM